MFGIFFSFLLGAEPIRRVDTYGVRYTTVKEEPNAPYNFIFVPGGAGMDSSYLRNLVQNVDFPGNVYFMDLPGNGTNTVSNPNYDDWFRIFPLSLKRFSNLVLVGHSFGGSLPLFFPELENTLKGLIILNSMPCFWGTAAVEYGKKFNLPEFGAEFEALQGHPCQENFNKALDVTMPYYFAKSSLEEGSRMLRSVPFPYQASAWWHRTAEKMYSTTPIWVPQNVPTLIIGGEVDCITPFSLFEKDERFNRPNIKRVRIPGSGHFSWVEKPAEVRGFLKSFIDLSVKNPDIFSSAKQSKL